MVTREHEAQIELNHQFPAIIIAELEAAGIKPPSNATVAMISERCTQTRPVELNADDIATITVDGELVMVVIHEVQRSADQLKRQAWVQYSARVWAKYQCPVVLLVYCPDPGLVTWASTPIDLGPVGEILPKAFSPASFPVITDPADWDGSIEHAVLAALAHADGPQGAEVVAVLSDLLATIEAERAAEYGRCLGNVLPEIVHNLWESLMSSGTYPYQDFAVRLRKRGRAEGKVEGKAEGESIGAARMVLSLLRARKIDVPESARRRIVSCTDPAQFDRWVIAAVNVERVDELFD